MVTVPLPSGQGGLPCQLCKYCDIIGMHTVYSSNKVDKDTITTKNETMKEIEHFLLFLVSIRLFITQSSKALFEERLHTVMRKMA